MATPATKTEFDNLSAFLCGRMISSDRETRVKAAQDAEQLIRDLPKSLRNSPHCQGEIEAMAALIERVSAEAVAAVSPAPTMVAGWEARRLLDGSASYIVSGAFVIASEVPDDVAALIAAAPDLLAALKVALPILKCHQESPDRVARYENAAAAIAKAEGI